MREKNALSVLNGRSGNRSGALVLSMSVLLCGILFVSAGCGSGGSADTPPIVVNSLDDVEPAPTGKVTLRAAIRDIEPGGRIVFDNSLNGGTILLTIVGDNNSVLKGEIYAGTPESFQGYQERNYGKSALYAAKNLTIDASTLPDGITLRWAGSDENPARPARVLAVYGNLTMRNVAVTGGLSRAEPISGGTLYTLARGGGVAVWGVATLDRCIVNGNRCDNGNVSGRDRGTYGGGIFANGIVMINCIVSGNAVIGSGGGGGGIYSVGGADGPGIDSSLAGCTVSGNRVTAKNAYGGGIFTLGGGPYYLKALRLSNCTIARNLVEDHAGLPLPRGYFYRGGGVYMGGGYLSVAGCTIAENEVQGVPNPATPNISGGGIAATIGNAHVVENMEIWHSVVAGNTRNGAPEDVYTGSVLHFFSFGYNRIGRIDFSQILVPIPPWWSLDRKHWPKAGDTDNVVLTDVLDVPGAGLHPSIVSVGTDNGQHAVLWYPPSGDAVDQIPGGAYSVGYVLAQYQVLPGKTDDFLNRLLAKVETDYSTILGSNFGTNYRAAFEAANGRSLNDVMWYENAVSWPSDPQNTPWINFWRGLDNAIAGRLGTAGLADDFWGSYVSGPLGDNVTIRVDTAKRRTVGLAGSDQLGNPRPYGLKGDIGAIEKTP